MSEDNRWCINKIVLSSSNTDSDDEIPGDGDDENGEKNLVNVIDNITLLIY